MAKKKQEFKPDRKILKIYKYITKAVEDNIYQNLERKSCNQRHLLMREKWKYFLNFSYFITVGKKAIKKSMGIQISFIFHQFIYFNFRGIFVLIFFIFNQLLNCFRQMKQTLKLKK